MKKLMMSLMIMVLGCSGYAQSKMNSVENAPNMTPYALDVFNKIDKSMFITIYNPYGDRTDSACVPAGNGITFNKYALRTLFRAQVQVRQNVDCSGNTIADMTQYMGSAWTLTVTKDTQGKYLLDSKFVDAPLNPNMAFSLINHNSHSLLVSAYDSYGLITNFACIRTGAEKAFYDVDNLRSRTVHVEIKQNEDCSGALIEYIDVSVFPGDKLEATNQTVWPIP
jgi:hypothetical protein